MLRRQAEGVVASADSLGRIFSLVCTDTIRAVNRHLYERLKRNKSFQLPGHGLVALAIDGHESHATYRQCCRGCLVRRVGSEENERTQYYHRNDTAQLVFENMCFQLDAEPQLAGEDEVAAALRLLERVLRNYPRAFDVVLADALYADPRFFNFLIDHKKDVLTVLKDNRRDLLKDAESIFASIQPITISEGKTEITCWDAAGFLSWPQVEQPVRVIKVRETKTVKRQLSKEIEEVSSSWTWVTTLSNLSARSQVVIQLGHARWCVENQGFNELVSNWHGDYVYKHAPVAILNFWLMTMISCNLFLAFYLRNLKPVLRNRMTMRHLSRQMFVELYGTVTGLPP